MTAIAFDLDGCIVESRGAILPSARAALVAHGLPSLSDDDLAPLIGPPITDGFADLLVRIGEDAGRADEIVTTFRADYQTSMLDRTVLMPGMGDALRQLTRSRTACVVTSKPETFATKILGHLGVLDLFALVAGPSLDDRHETKTTTLDRAIAHLDVAVMVGDRHHDIDAGRAHGLVTIGVTWGMGDHAELDSADHVVDTPDELLAVIL